MIMSQFHLKRRPLVPLSKVWSVVSVWLNLTLGLVLDNSRIQWFWIKMFAKCVDSKSLMNSPGKNLNELRALGFWGRAAKKHAGLKFTGSPFDKVLFIQNFMKRPYCCVVYLYQSWNQIQSRDGLCCGRKEKRNAPKCSDTFLYTWSFVLHLKKFFSYFTQFHIKETQPPYIW